MRISDWSSDVCSSDLVPPAHHRARAPHVARRVSHRPRGGLLSELWQPAPRTAEAKAAHAAAEADRSARPERYRLDPETVASAAAKHPDDLERFAPGWRAGLERYLGSARSEEHTSELQSLMRISYAVFGLANKKTAYMLHESHSPNYYFY